MINKRLITLNAASSVIQIVVSGITLFLLYRVLLNTIGAAQLGIWSLVLATSSMVQVANLGLTGSIVKHIADHDAVGDKSQISLVIQTSVISIAIFAFFLVAIAFPMAKYYFKFVLESGYYGDAVEILPLALFSFWIYMIAGIYQGALYGCQLITWRNWILIADSISYLIMCLIVAPKYGLVGLAYARVVQNIMTLVVTIVLLKRHVRELPFFPQIWSKPLFKEMFNYAAKFQIISFLVMLFDPITKGFLSKYGSVSLVAYYEMANKLVQLFRSLLVNANQVLVPTFAQLNKLDPGKVSGIYLVSYKIVIFLAFPGFCLLGISAPLVSEFWVGRFEPDFVWSMVILCGGYLFNTLCVPAYYSALGTGDMTENVVTHLVMTLTNIVLILVIGRLWGGMGVVIAWAAALALGGGVLNFLYFRRNAISLNNIIPKSNRLLAFLCLIGFLVCFLVWQFLPIFLDQLLLTSTLTDSTIRIITGSIMPVLFFAIIYYPVLNHPIKKDLTNWIADIRTK